MGLPTPFAGQLDVLPGGELEVGVRVAPTVPFEDVVSEQGRVVAHLFSLQNESYLKKAREETFSAFHQPFFAKFFVFIEVLIDNFGGTMTNFNRLAHTKEENFFERKKNSS